MGRDARLELTFERRDGRTVVAHAYAEPPFRIGPSVDVADAAYLIVVCSGPGVFAGDALRQSIHVKSGARVVLTSQSALQVHPSAAPSPAIVHHQYRVDDDGELHCQWDPVIPFADARLHQRFDLDVARRARLYWSDALMSGRASRGEAWRFRELAHELRLQIDGRLTYLERYQLRPAERSLDRTWIAGDANYVATTLVHHRAATREVAEALQASIPASADLRAGVDLIDDTLLLARLTAASGVPFSAARRVVRRFAVEEIFNHPELADRK